MSPYLRRTYRHKSLVPDNSNMKRANRGNAVQHVHCLGIQLAAGQEKWQWIGGTPSTEFGFGVEPTLNRVRGGSWSFVEIPLCTFESIKFAPQMEGRLWVELFSNIFPDCWVGHASGDLRSAGSWP